MEVTEERISDMKDKILEITPSEQQRKSKLKTSEWSLKDLWDYSIHISKVLEVEQKGRTKKTPKETMAEIFPNLTEDNQIPNKIYPRHLVKVLESKKKLKTLTKK